MTNGRNSLKLTLPTKCAEQRDLMLMAECSKDSCQLTDTALRPTMSSGPQSHSRQWSARSSSAENVMESRMLPLPSSGTGLLVCRLLFSNCSYQSCQFAAPEMSHWKLFTTLSTLCWDHLLQWKPVFHWKEQHFAGTDLFCSNTRSSLALAGYRDAAQVHGLLQVEHLKSVNSRDTKYIWKV